MPDGLSKNDLITASSDVVTADLSLDGTSSLVMLGLQDGIYYELKGIGVRLWELVQEPRSFCEVVDVVLSEYDVSREQCIADLDGLIAKLADHGLIEVRRAT
jgi:hypothetical protein